MRNCGREGEGEIDKLCERERAIGSEIETERGRERERAILSPLFFSFYFLQRIHFLIILISKNSKKIQKISIKNVNSLCIQYIFLMNLISLTCS